MVPSREYVPRRPVASTERLIEERPAVEAREPAGAVVWLESMSIEDPPAEGVRVSYASAVNFRFPVLVKTQFPTHGAEARVEESEGIVSDTAR